MSYLCIAFERKPSGCSAVRLAHLLWEQGVPSSNLGTPTTIRVGINKGNLAITCKRSRLVFYNTSILPEADLNNANVEALIPFRLKNWEFLTILQSYNLTILQ